MSKAEERALEFYPMKDYNKEPNYIHTCDTKMLDEVYRDVFKIGYQQAEQDLEWEVNHREEAYTKGFNDGLKERLTWEDAQLLHIITEKYMRELDNRIEAFPSSSQELFEEILRRFYEKKQ